LQIDRFAGTSREFGVDTENAPGPNLTAARGLGNRCSIH